MTEQNAAQLARQAISISENVTAVLNTGLLSLGGAAQALESLATAVEVLARAVQTLADSEQE